jgi:hypothetical protein
MTDRRLEDETGEHYVVVDERRRHQVLGFSTWQWAVIGTLIVSVVIGTAVGRIALTAKHNTERLNQSICAQVVYLDGIRTPGPEQQRRIDKLVHDLRALQDCPPPPPPIVAPGG